MPRPVKILATSDIHGFLAGLLDICSVQQPDVLLIAGDIHPCEIGVSPDTWFEHEFFPFVYEVGKKGCEVIAVPGNHDYWLAAHGPAMRLKGTLPFRDMPVVPENFHLLVDSEYKTHGLRFYGTPWVPWISGHWCFEEEDDDLRVRFAAIPEGVDFLISHSPPRYDEANLDISLQRPPEQRRHFGSVALRDAIERKKPRYCICGHIHSGYHGGFTAPCGTKIYNVSRVDERYHVYYAPLLLEVK